MSLPLQSVQNLLNKNNSVNFWVYSNFPLLGENCKEKHRKQQCQKSPRAMQEGDVFHAMAQEGSGHTSQFRPKA